MVYDIQDSLLKTIKEDGIEKCLHEVHKTESMIEQCKRCQEYKGIKGILVTIRSSILSAGDGLKAMAKASTKVGAGPSYGQGEIASIVLPATNPSSALPGVKVAKNVVQRLILPNVAGVVVAVPKAGVPKRSERLLEGQGKTQI